jgi:hypothetical protein
VGPAPSGGQWFYVIGILNKDTYAPEIDSAVLTGFPAAEKYLHFDGHPSQIYVRTVNTPAVTTRVDSMLGYQANPENPNQVDVSQPSAALTAQADAKGALDTLFLGLGAIALLVGAIGVANIMVISVLERRSEIGLRRALGATKVPGRRRRRRRHRRRRHRHLRLRPPRAPHHPARSLGGRPGRRCRHRRPGRAAARHSRRPAVPHSGALEHLTAQAPRTASFAGCRCEQRLRNVPQRARADAWLAVGCSSWSRTGPAGVW